MDGMSHRSSIPACDGFGDPLALALDEAGGARILAKYAGLCLLDDDPYDCDSPVLDLGRRLSDSVGQEAFKRTELARAFMSLSASRRASVAPRD